MNNKMDFLPILVLISCTILTAQAVITGHATCDNRMYFYADGVQKAYSNNWQQASALFLPDNTKVIAVKCIDYHVIAGIKVALNNGIKTDKTWKCTNKLEANWNKPGFDDSQWTSAVEYVDSRWGSQPAVLNNKASWIWTSKNTGGDKTVYCRKELKQDCDCCEETKRSLARLHSKVDFIINSLKKPIISSFTKPITLVRKPTISNKITP